MHYALSHRPLAISLKHRRTGDINAAGGKMPPLTWHPLRARLIAAKAALMANGLRLMDECF